MSKNEPQFYPFDSPFTWLLRKVGKTNCLFCETPATRVAVLGVSTVRCCDKEPCGEKAKEFARIAA